MDFRFPPEVEAFQAEVRARLREELVDVPSDPLDLTGVEEAFERRLHARAGERGWLGLTGDRLAVFQFEVAAADAPLIDTAMTLAGSTVAAFGDDDQRRSLLPRMLAGEVELCIAYTEEGAGGDLAAIESVARPDGDGFVLSGTKVLVTGAHKADWCVTVAHTRLDVPARRGMTMFLLDMRAPGVEVRRRPTMNGWTLDDVVFHDVRLDAGAVLGTVDDGWRQLVSAVQAERSGMFYLGFARHVLDLLATHVGPSADLLVRDRIARLEADFAAGDRLARRALWTHAQGDVGPALPSMVKVFATELLQRVAQAATEIAGHAGLVHAPLYGDSPPHAAAGGRLAWEYLERVHATIGVGVNEVHRDGIAQAGLGLPRPGR